jgi:arylsulfatase A-like enzyme
MKKILTLLFLCISLNANAQRNVILIIADDLGSDYCGFYENHLDTVAMPNVRRLLKKGVRFRNAWSNPLCSPTRAGILTGRYSFRTGVGTAVGGAGSAVLSTDEITIPKLLNIYSPNGIAKANIGKWHLNLSTPTSNYNIPNLLGYDHFEGSFSGGLSSYTNWAKVTNSSVSTITNYATTETADNAITWIKAQKDKPFFLWLAFNAPHTPYHLPPAGLYSDVSLSGTASDITANPKKYFKASVEALDHEIGRLFDSLESLQKWDNTDIIFIGDNGNDPLSAQVSGGAKGSVYQEGVSVPFIISGPSVVSPNRVSNALVNTQDLFATILELMGATTWQNSIPANKPVDSKSILPILKNTASTIRPWAFTEVFKEPTVSGDGKAMRNTDYKLISFDNCIQKFYNISVDTAENNNLLLGTLTATELTNYNYLRNEINTLVTSGVLCNINTGIDDEKSTKQSIIISPNPFQTEITITFSKEQKNTSVKIIDLLGKEIKTLKFTGKQLTIEKGEMQSGIYFVQIKGENTTAFSSKIILQ